MNRSGGNVEQASLELEFKIKSKQLKEADFKIVALEKELKTLKESKSWKLTKPLRDIGRAKRAVLTSLDLHGMWKGLIKIILRTLKFPIREFISLRNHRKEEAFVTETPDIQNFWDESHAKDARRWITGSSPTDELGYLEVLNRITLDEKLKILVVGVGTGATTKFLLERNHDVDILDISPVALGRIDLPNDRKYLTSEYSRLPIAK